ncbi:MAG: cell division protein FtsQ/DivIB [Actinomycetota bacterium]
MASSIASPTERALAGVRTALTRVWRPLAVACAALALVASILMLTRSGVFHVRRVEVDGAAHLSRAEVVRLSAITKSDNAIWLDAGAAESRLTGSPWVADAEVKVDLPWTVTITVTERSPIAVLERGATEVLLAADGTLLGAGRRAGLPVIEASPTSIGSAGSVPLQGIARALEALPADLRALVRRVEIGAPLGLELFLSDGVRISYGSPRAFEQKARAITDVLTWVGEAGERIRLVNVSAPSAPAVVLSN